MNLANKLTLTRIALIPMLLVVLYWGFPLSNWVAVAIFIAASLTDLVDGRIARSRNLVTAFGKFMDPLADKMLVAAVMCWLVDAGRMAGWVLVVVLMREFAVSGLRLVAVERGRVIAAAWSGKVKTVVTMVCLGFMIAFHIFWMNIAGQALILVTTLYSGVEYFVKNIDVMK